MDATTTQQAVFQYQLFTTVASATAFLASVAAVIRTYRREPPLAETMLKEFATKEDLTQLRADLEKVRTEINQQLRSGDKCFKDLERVIGQLETMFKLCPYLCGRKGPL